MFLLKDRKNRRLEKFLWTKFSNAHDKINSWRVFFI